MNHSDNFTKIICNYNHSYTHSLIVITLDLDMTHDSRQQPWQTLVSYRVKIEELMIEEAIAIATGLLMLLIMRL